MITTERMAAIMNRITLTGEAITKNEEEAKFAVEVAAEIRAIKRKGWEVRTPPEIPSP